ncbi:TPA: ParB N-terminal domain-containing protein [Escherichia coli]|uniref:ParB N-terminal domain-containing protein n=1 Tax=Escherichia coli TaxID=562 RepID=UPI001F2E29BF|nr:ParB N-terminal domain-containing protein [Escherichia coli]MCF4091657.1 ParB N-terminal domain-containing protein [Escherichia coli]MCX8338052.1 ParB N-terminal domain-containing protein [Escherichia coli]
MAPSEKRLLTHSLLVDGFTQPVVTLAQKGKYTVIDGFHRQMLGKSTTKILKMTTDTVFTITGHQ